MNPTTARKKLNIVPIRAVQAAVMPATQSAVPRRGPVNPLAAVEATATERARREGITAEQAFAASLTGEAYAAYLESRR
jgi:hypothetical protein